MINEYGRSMAGFTDSHFHDLSIFAVTNRVILLRAWLTL